MPVFVADKNEKNKGTVVRDLKLGFTLPDAYKTTLFAFGSMNAGTDKISSFNPWLFSNTDEQRVMVKKEFESKHKNALRQLAEAKKLVGQKPENQTHRKRLQDKVKQYVSYPTKDILEANQINRPLWQYDLEFTLDGINGFRYGDVLQCKALPKRYQDQCVFCIKQITHTVSEYGEWSTVVSCWARARLNENV